MVTTQWGIVAASQPLAARAGVEILERGGNAVDAAIAANAAIGLMEPTGNGIGGDLFAIVYEAKTGKMYGLNASGWSPAGTSAELLKSKGETKMPQKGIHSVTVPGAVAGWDALRTRFGTKPFSELLAPAIYYAENGFPVSEVIAGHWAASTPMLAAHPNSAETFLPGGHAPGAGEMFRNPDLGASLRRIARDGRDGYYKGSTAEAILQISREQGGTLSAADLAEFQPEWVEPIRTTYRGWTVTELPPNGTGIAALMMLNIMEQFPLGEWGPHSTKTMHAMIEAKKLAYADLVRYIGDPRFSQLPVSELLSKSHAQKQAKRISPTQAACNVEPSRLEGFTNSLGRDTIYLSVVDKDGNIVSLIQSNYSGFGSGLVPPGTGFMLHNRGGLFTLEDNHPNTLAPRKRPLHTIIPGFMEKDGTRIAFGIQGGFNQPQAHAQFVANVADHGMNIQQALESGRFTKKNFEGCDVDIEASVP
ncbi:MAG: gamma-glutamyltransferase, partial [Myxococcaceae bacterium]|nr:gamma-glutamyltransferase [Myxococcaceae bacterium]